VKNVISILVFLFFIGNMQYSFAQANLDSLFTVWNDNTEADTNRLDAIHEIAWDGYLFIQPDSGFYYAQLEYEFAKKKGLKKQMGDAIHTQGVSFYIKGDYDRAYEYFIKSKNIWEKIGDKEGVAGALNTIGIIYDVKGDYSKAIDYYSQSLKIREELKDTIGISGCYNNLGLVYKNQGQYARAIEYYTESLKIREERKDKKGIATSLMNIGLIYQAQKGYQKALEYIEKALKIDVEIGNVRGEGMAYNNIGIIYDAQNDFENAKKFYSKSLEIKEGMGDKQGSTTTLLNIGIVYEKQGEYEKSLEYKKQSYKIAEEVGDKLIIAATLNSLGSTYFKQKKYGTAISSSVKALEISQEIGAIVQVRDASFMLYESYEAIGNDMQALEMYELFIETRDSIESEENQKEVIRQEYKYTYEKQKAIDDKDHEKQLAISAEQEQKQKIVSYAIAGGLGLVVVFSIFIFNRLQVTRKQKLVIEEQKEEVEHQKTLVEVKNQEITDSIQYAKRIQSAILPPEKVVKEYLQESFILYKPKDIVAGDFYWMEHTDGKVLFAAADCTGHGVPGAMVSVVCNNALNRSVREHGLIEPGKILDQTRKIVIAEFEKSDEEVKDGMDIALCSLEGTKLQYAGAHNPLWIMRNGEIVETKANKQPIGQFDNYEPYTTHSFDLKKGDTLYIFSDGYVDQFGGEKGKKFKSKSFKELLLSIQDETMSEQKKIIDGTFINWKGNLEQIDDVCVIGVRI
jgi:tetratricopeptide (TPR) repeat protein